MSVNPSLLPPRRDSGCERPREPKGTRPPLCRTPRRFAPSSRTLLTPRPSCWRGDSSVLDHPHRQLLEGPQVTHLRKGLAAAETVNLHLVEAGDLHGVSEERRPTLQARSLPRASALRDSAACGVWLAAPALADDALPALER